MLFLSSMIKNNIFSWYNSQNKYDYKISTFSEGLSFLNPKIHLKMGEFILQLNPFY